MIWDFVKQKAQSLLHNSVEAVQKCFMVWFHKKYGANKKHRDYMVCYAKHQLELHARIAFYEYMSAKIALRSEDEIQRLKKILDNLIMESDALGWGKLKTDALIQFSLSSEGQKIIANIEEMTRCAVGLHELFESEAYQNHKEATAQFFREQMLEKRKQDILALMQAEQNQTDTSELEEFKTFARENNYRVFDTGLAGYLQALPNDEIEALQVWMDKSCYSEIEKRIDEAQVSNGDSRFDRLSDRALSSSKGTDDNKKDDADLTSPVHGEVGLQSKSGEGDSLHNKTDSSVETRPLTPTPLPQGERDSAEFTYINSESRHSCEGRNPDKNPQDFNSHNNDNISAPLGQGLDACLRRHDGTDQHQIPFPLSYKSVGNDNDNIIPLTLIPLPQGERDSKPPPMRKRKFQKCLFFTQKNCVLKLLTT